MNLWEQGKDRRRRAIIDAAKALISAHGLSGLSMRALADASGVSLATVYNLIGSKEAVIFAVVTEALDALDDALRTTSTRDPLRRAASILEQASAVFSERADVYRPVMGAVEDAAVGPHKLSVMKRGRGLMLTAIEDAIEAGDLAPHVPPGLVARQIFSGYSQSVRYWSRGELSHRGFRAHALAMLFTHLMALATDAGRPRLQAQLRRLSPDLRRIESGEDQLVAREEVA